MKRANQGTGNDMTIEELEASGVELRPIPGLVGYCAGSDGIIYSFHRIGYRAAGMTKYMRTPRRLSSVGLRKDGYPWFLALHWRGTRHYQVHRLVCSSFYGPCPEGKECSHLDGNPANNQPENLRWETPSQNNSRKVQHGTSARGSRNYASKLYDADVLAIRKRLSRGETQSSVAQSYNVDPSLISHIHHRRAWAWLDG